MGALGQERGSCPWRGSQGKPLEEAGSELELQYAGDRGSGRGHSPGEGLGPRQQPRLRPRTARCWAGVAWESPEPVTQGWPSTWEGGEGGGRRLGAGEGQGLVREQGERMRAKSSKPLCSMCVHTHTPYTQHTHIHTARRNAPQRKCLHHPSFPFQSSRSPSPTGPQSWEGNHRFSPFPRGERARTSERETLRGPDQPPAVFS